MIRRDWLKVHIETLAQAVAVALRLKGKGELQAADAAVETAIEKGTGLSGRLALTLSAKDFVSLACRGEKPAPELLDALSKVFRQWAEVLEAQGHGDEAALARARCEDLLRLGK